MRTRTRILLSLAAFTAISVPLALYHSARSDTRKTQALQTKSQPAATRPHGPAQTPVAESGPRTGERRYQPPPVTPQVRQAVDGIIRRHHGMSIQEMQRSAEINKLMDRFLAGLSTSEMQAKVMERLSTISAQKGEAVGTVMIEFGELGDPLGRSWLEAVVSDDPQLMEEWMLNSIDGAIFEFGFDPDLDRTSTGVSVHPPKPADPASQTGFDKLIPPE